LNAGDRQNAHLSGFDLLLAPFVSATKIRAVTNLCFGRD
jgi:hypothetical protein